MPVDQSLQLKSLSTAPLKLATDRELWERQPGEDDRTWGCFELYRDLHPSVRSLARAYGARRKLQDPDFDESMMYNAPKWFAKMSVWGSWVDRARAYDEWRDTDTLQRLQSTRVRYLVETAEIGRELREKAARALHALNAVKYEMIIDEDGNPDTIEVSNLSPAAIIQLVKAGAELERAAIGLSPISGAGGVSVNIANIIGAPGQASVMPNPDGDDLLTQRVREIITARTGDFELITAPPSAPGEEGGT